MKRLNLSKENFTEEGWKILLSELGIEYKENVTSVDVNIEATMLWERV